MSLIIDLRNGPAKGEFKRCGKGGRFVRTTFQLLYANGALCITLEAEDPDMLNLEATVSKPDTDAMLFEEDCCQIALAQAGQITPSGMLLVNARGSRRSFGEGAAWSAEVTRHAAGWHLELRLPLPGKVEMVGLSLHRFFRGIAGGTSALASNLPHPLKVSSFACLMLGGSAPADAGKAFLAQAADAEEADLNARVQALGERVKTACAAGVPESFMAFIHELIERRQKEAIKPATSYLCWNEAYFQHALMDLWEMTGDRAWLERLIPRIEEVWSLTGSARKIKDALWGMEWPTWYNETETGSICTLTSGVVLWPVARWIRIAMKAPELRDLQQTAQSWIPKARAVLDLHDQEWVDFPDGSGMHLEPFPKGPRRLYPRGGSRVNPLNREFFFALPMLEMARVTGEPRYWRMVEANARYFRNTSEVTDDYFIWEYHVDACPAEGEDLSHAASQVAFAEHCFEDGLVITEADLRKMARTLAGSVFRFGAVPAECIRGDTPGLNMAVGAWSSLCRFEPETLHKIRKVLATGIYEQNRLFNGSQGFGIRILTIFEKAARRLAHKD